MIFDTNRAWTAKLPALMRLFPEAKVICCVRDVAWVMDSLERQYRNNAFEHTRLFNNPAERSTVYTRVEALAHANRLVGFAWHATREACYSEFAERVLMLEYDLLAGRPADVFKLVYEFLGEDAVQARLHQGGIRRAGVRRPARPRRAAPRAPEVKPQSRKTILPPDLFKRYAQLSFWRDLKDSKAFRIVTQPTAEKQRDTMPEPAQAIAPEAVR